MVIIFWGDIRFGSTDLHTVCVSLSPVTAPEKPGQFNG